MVALLVAKSLRMASRRWAFPLTPMGAARCDSAARNRESALNQAERQALLYEARLGTRSICCRRQGGPRIVPPKCRCEFWAT
jgi:hypothetical protein